MRVSLWGKRRSYHQMMKKKVTREIEDRGQLLVLAVFLLLVALSTPEQASSWLLGGACALVSFHASTASVHRAQGLEKGKQKAFRRRAFRRRVLFLGLVVITGYVIPQVEFATLVTAILTVKVSLYFLAPRRSTWSASSAS